MPPDIEIARQRLQTIPWKETLPQLESSVSADEQARLLNDPPMSFGNVEQGARMEKK